MIAMNQCDLHNQLYLFDLKIKGSVFGQTQLICGHTYFTHIHFDHVCIHQV